MPPCLCVGRACCGGFKALGQGTAAHLCSSVAGCGPPVGVSGGLCVHGALGPSSEAWVPYHKAAGESVGRVTCGFLQPTTEPQRGARGVWSEVDPERLGASRWMGGPGAC